MGVYVYRFKLAKEKHMQIKLGTKNTGARFPITRSTDRHGTWEQQKMEKKRRFQNI